VEVLDGQKVLYMGDEKLATVDEILIATGRHPNVESLNLDIAGVKVAKHGIQVNQKLQTTNSRIYACGDVIGGYQFTHVAGYEASVVLKNALFLPASKADYRVVPWCTFTDPELAKVGLSEAEARQSYGDDIYVLKQGICRGRSRPSRRVYPGICQNYYPQQWRNLRGHLCRPIGWRINP
jgi:pyruvate/2-oxoglutarate dehydrogenase complex dihydrolipoamide dehydrogenase (E3) component